jgi:hypothetical protein
MLDEKKAPLVGQFSGPPGNVPRTPSSLPRKPPAEDPPVPEGKEETGKESKVQEDDTPRAKTPQEKASDYAKGLKSVGLSPEEARAILEMVLVSDNYEESRKMGPIEVVIRTRNYKDANRTLRFLELEKPTYALGINDLIARYNMAASLVSYGKNVFSHPSKKNGASDEEIENAFHERLAFVFELPVVAVDKLQQLVYDLDQKIGAVFAEGAPEDF